MSIDNLAQKTVKKVLTPFSQFSKNQVTSSILLLFCTAIALLWANSVYVESYHKIFSTPFGLNIGNWEFNLSLEAWISEGLMAIFFFYLGLEVKRELLVGELRQWQQSMPVIMAAIGGMVFPALIYFFIAKGGNSSDLHGWGIPMATDTAFAIGILAILGRRVPAGVALFVTALAIIDDLGAMLIIALVYTESISFQPILLVALLTLLLVFASKGGIRNPIFYFFIGVAVWAALHSAHVHATVAGVIVALTIPTGAELSRKRFIKSVNGLLKRFELGALRRKNKPFLADAKQHELLEEVENRAEKAAPPLTRFESLLVKPVTLLVMPVFALANAGVTFPSSFITNLFTSRIAIGIFFGLVLGKCLGIVFMAKLTLILGWGQLQKGLSMSHVVGIGLLAGIGFTMSILISTLAFTGSPESLLVAKSAILGSSLVSGICSYCWFRFLTKST